MIVLNMFATLIYPVYVSYLIKSHPMAANYLMVVACTLALKLVSFHHVMHDNRALIRRVIKSDTLTTKNPEDNVFNLPQIIYQEALKYPKNLNIKHFVRFLCMPTCCYQLVFPTT